MKNSKINILIVTAGRLDFLTKCLNSLKKQTVWPGEIIIIDNSYKYKTKKIIADFKKNFEIIYKTERYKGEAFVRNRAIKETKRKLSVFIDDDCLASENWLENIQKTFDKQTTLDGIVGKTENHLRENIYANVYQCYYIRWLMENFEDITKTSLLGDENSFFDTKNFAFKKKLVKNFCFDPEILFHSINVDNIAGKILSKKGKVFFIPNIVVHHYNPSSFFKLMTKNFFQGMADELLLKKKKINPRQRKIKVSLLSWLKNCQKEIAKLNFTQKLLFWPIFFIYPVPYKLGRLFYKIKYSF